ncbi:bifunctional Tetratricopeptide-like helical domain superfamily/SET domain superfamily/SET domain [Babesia duncani]|uniref:Bifunctional Tetratricopeptide-like helical domain superfamily/SET domain superfamily/SET domain n=1 Tax=Babesia duncani TaxID=323732 RepID=A0AAD9PJ66_9APIC|nr:bifunctional Tetratricopeptide-like helical domain superfamily/SET domain superfamily/SET domain [Babesia duncani]
MIKGVVSNADKSQKNDATTESTNTSLDNSEKNINAESVVLEPYSRSHIFNNVEIAEVTGKGRCLFARNGFEPGDIIIVEAPLFSIVPSSNQSIWDVLTGIHELTPLSLPPLWHQAAILSIIDGTEEKHEILKKKWVIDKNPEVSEDVFRVLQAICNCDESGRYIYKDTIEIDQKLYQYFLQVWQLNAFGHSTDADGLVIYDAISNMAHSCDASCSWHHYGDDCFILRARRKLYPGDEITISYLGESDLFAPTFRRRDLLNNWCFTCSCERCGIPKDDARGFLCKCCHAGCVIMVQDDLLFNVVAHPCTLCGYKYNPTDVNEYLELEQAYIQRIDTIDSNDLYDILQVYDHARNVFKQHWALYQLETLLFEIYKQQGNNEQALYYLTLRIQYADLVMKRPMFAVAFMYEQLGDLLVSHANIDVDSSEIKNCRADIGMLNNILSAYFKSAALLCLLCGCNHAYYYVVVTKRNKIEEIAQGLLGQAACATQEPS